MNMPKTKTYKTLVFEKDYDDFHNFYESNKKEIYDSIFETMNGFVDKKNKKLVLQVSAKIQSEDWGTEFVFKPDDFIILKRDLIPFYEKIEDYEMCDKINNLHKHFTT